MFLQLLFTALHCTALFIFYPELALAVHSSSCPSTGTCSALFILSQHWHWQSTLHLVPALALASCPSTGTGSSLFILSQHWHWQCTLHLVSDLGLSAILSQYWHWQCTLHLVPALALAVHSSSCPSTGTGSALLILILFQHWHWHCALHLVPVLALALFILSQHWQCGISMQECGLWRAGFCTRLTRGHHGQDILHQHLTHTLCTVHTRPIFTLRMR